MVDPRRGIIITLEDDERRQSAMEKCFAQFPAFQTAFFDTSADTIACLKTRLQETSLISLDHDLGPGQKRGDAVLDPGTGRDVVNYLTTQPPCCPIIIHSSNDIAAVGMEFELLQAGWTVSRVIPFNDLEWVTKEWFVEVKKQLR